MTCESNDMKTARLWSLHWPVRKSRFIPKFYVLEKTIAASRRAIFWLGLASTLLSPSRSPAAPPARTTVFSSCYRTPDFPQKCSRQNRANNNWVNCPTVSLVRTLTRSLNHFYSSCTNLSKKYHLIKKNSLNL